jgi:hypothetical protein
MTPQEFGVYKYIEAVSHKSGVFYCDAKAMADEFEGRAWRTFQDLVEKLFEKGWLQMLSASGRNAQGLYYCAQYAIVSHDDWTKTHAKKCRLKPSEELETDTTVAADRNGQPLQLDSQPLQPTAQPLQPTAQPLQPAVASIAANCNKVSKEKYSKEKREKKSKKEPLQQSATDNQNPSSFSSSTPKASGKKKRAEHPWVIDIVREALKTNDAAHFETWDRMAISEVLHKNPDFEREEALTATRLFIVRLGDDKYELAKAGKGLAGRFDAEILNAGEYIAKQKYAVEQVAKQIAARKAEEETKRQELIEVCSVGPSGEGLF